MKLSEMTDEQKNRWIAEHEEPESDLPQIKRIEQPSPSFPARFTLRPGELSPKEFWKIGPGMKWRPRDAIHDPAMRDLLLRKLIEDGWYIEINGSEYTFKVDDWGFGSFDDLPLAFMLASGFKED